MQIYDKHMISFVELDKEISITFGVRGCTLGCPDCFWQDFDETREINDLPLELYESILEKYKGKATCVLFLGGEWCDCIIDYLKKAKEYGYKTCLYTGLYYTELYKYNSKIIDNLDYLKTGRFNKELGTIDSPTTNQRLIRLTDMKIIKGKGFLDE